MPEAKVSLYVAGRGTGKTRSATEFLLEECLTQPGTQAAILGPTFQSSVQVGIFSSESGVMSLLPDESLASWNDVKKELHFVNGSMIRCYSSEHRRNMRGPEFHIAWVDEMADLSHGMECWQILLPAVRLKSKSGKPARVYCTGTPRPTELMMMLHKEAEAGRYEYHQGATGDNVANLDESTVRELYDQYEGTRYFMQEILGVLLFEAEHALWSQDTISACRKTFQPVEFERIAIGVDPALTSDKRADHTGIIVAGIDIPREEVKPTAYVLADYSRQASPLEWSRDLVHIARRHGASTIVYEKNLAGPLIRDVMVKALDEMDAAIRLVPVQAAGKKHARAEPIAALYEAGRVRHMPHPDAHGASLEKLESQMVTWEPTMSGSPDRIDALVHVIDHLLLRGGKSTIMRAGQMPWAKRR
jgi:phage terminase large subunit-like protein